MSRPKPTAIRRLEGNPGNRGYNHDEPVPPETLPDCPEHLNPEAKAEWQRLAQVLHDMAIVTLIDRAALAAYCQCWGRWVEAEEKLRTTPILLKTKTGYIQQSPWLSIANRQMELMGRYMTELGLTPAARSRLAIGASSPTDQIDTIKLVVAIRDPISDVRVTLPDNIEAPAARGPGDQRAAPTLTADQWQAKQGDAE